MALMVAGGDGLVTTGMEDAGLETWETETAGTGEGGFVVEEAGGAGALGLGGSTVLELAVDPPYTVPPPGPIPPPYFGVCLGWDEHTGLGCCCCLGAETLLVVLEGAGGLDTTTVDLPPSVSLEPLDDDEP